MIIGKLPSRYFHRIENKLKTFQAKPKFEHTHSFTGAEFKMYRTPAVYAWKRGEEWLYIGCTSRGLTRLTETNHEVLGKAKIQDTDTILIMHNLTRWEAHHLETLLIREHKPKYNK